jgi:hypothetical protein
MTWQIILLAYCVIRHLSLTQAAVNIPKQRRAHAFPLYLWCRAAGLELGARGGIKVDDRMRTSDPAIYAVGR